MDINSVKGNAKQEDEADALLQVGQVWTFKDKCLEVKRVGKYLVEFLVTQKDRAAIITQEPLRTGKHLESIHAVQKFLRSHNAVLQGT